MLAVPCMEKTGEADVGRAVYAKNLPCLPWPVADRALQWEVALPLKASTEWDPGGRSCSALGNDITTLCEHRMGPRRPVRQCTRTPHCRSKPAPSGTRAADRAVSIPSMRVWTTCKQMILHDLRYKGTHHGRNTTQRNTCKRNFHFGICSGRLVDG